MCIRDRGGPKVIEAELAGSMDGSDDAPAAGQPSQVASVQPPAQKALPFQVKKPATQADVDAIAVGTLPAVWAVEIGDFKTRKSASDVVAKLNDAVKKALADPEVVAKLADLGLEVAFSSPAEFGAYVNEQIESFAKLVRIAKVAPN